MRTRSNAFMASSIETARFSYPDPQTLRYAEQIPFPHAEVSGCWDQSLLERCKWDLGHFQNWDGKDTEVSRRKQTCSKMEALPDSVRTVIDEATRPRFLAWLSALTGEKILLPDPHLEGGGIHRIHAGGFLKVHADFNWHHRIHLFRRLNLLLYLNPAWDESWGGALELWTRDVKRCEKKIFPRLNTMAIFTTDDRSFHGHPHPLACPADVRRDSIALYYYSPIRPEANFDGERTATNWKPVQGDVFYDTTATFPQRVRRKLKSMVRL